MPRDVLSERILQIIRESGEQPRDLKDIARALGIADAEYGDFHAACRALMRTGRVVRGSGDALLLPEPPGKITGTYRANPKGFGFVVPDAPELHGDLYIPFGSAGDAMTGDKVVAQVSQGKKGKRLSEGRIIDIVRRGQSRLVGELVQQGRRSFVLPDGNILHVPIEIGDPAAKGAASGDQVVVELTQYPSGTQSAKGVIVKVLGRRGDPGVDTLSIVEQNGFPLEFPEEVLADARQVVDAFGDATGWPEREDLSRLPTLTIDPVDARDFDDAISIEPRADGSVELGVHIADVAHFVSEGGVLDLEARKRANSVYLPRMVIPMLPESLSNGVCSLQERQKRLTKSAFITFDDRGQVLGAHFCNSVIRSMKRLTYEQVDTILSGKVGRTSAKVVTLLQQAERLARVIRERRLREGMLVLDLPEVEPVFDDEGVLRGVRPADRGFSHTVIEMFMVEANEAVARHLRDLEVPCLRRIHDARSDLSDGSLQRFLRALGHDLPRKADRFDLQKLLDEVRGVPEGFPVHLAVLRSMKQAEYSPAMVGHFALASSDYCHFTSPIRRYPDLTIHRLLDASVRGVLTTKLAPSSSKGKRRKSAPVYTAPDEKALAELGAHCSTNERRAEAAERELKLVMTLRLLEGKIGEVEPGVVTGVANIGVYVQLENYLIDGLLRFEQLPDDWWRVDSSRGAVVGERSGRRITVGDRLKVTLSKVIIPTRQLDLALAETPAEWKATTRKPRDQRGDRNFADRHLGRRSRSPKRGRYRGR